MDVAERAEFREKAKLLKSLEPRAFAFIKFDPYQVIELFEVLLDDLDEKDAEIEELLDEKGAEIEELLDVLEERDAEIAKLKGAIASTSCTRLA